MSEPVISAENLGIRFHRNRRRHRQVRETLFKGKTGTPPGDFWAVNNVNFEIQPGEAVGLIGANGSGKSTLLKLVAGVLLPDNGKVTVNGGVAPLIELTGGFVADLTARDNIQITAGLHGLSKKSIQDRFDEIVDFAEIEDFVDTPFRHFSSGMKVRLGFAVISQLDEPIMLVDEVLAVGDRRFREKCYKKLVKNDKKDKKNISVKSNSSSDKSIANDSDDEVEEEPEKPKDKYLAGVCFLKMKK